MTIKVGAPRYVNALPLLYAIQHHKIDHDIELVVDHPTAINALFQQKELDAALISSFEFLTHHTEYTIASNLGIGAQDVVMSVCLYSKVPPEKLNGKMVALAEQSATSNVLFQVLAEHYWKIHPQITVVDFNTAPIQLFDAFLLIGDACLTAHHLDGFIKTDLSTAWWQMTKKPFIYALFATRNENQAATEKVHELISKSYEWSCDNIEEIITYASNKLKLPQKMVANYYQTIRYRLDDSYLKGLEHFAELISTLI